MRANDRLRLSSCTVAALPIVNHFLDRLRFAPLLEHHLPPPDPRAQSHPAGALGILLRSLILCRGPLYSLPAWASRMLPQLIGAETPEKLSDDRIGRALDRLFDADRAALLTEFVLGLITEFRIGLKQLHTDATTITLSGLYREADGRAVRGQTTVKAAFGHSKDHRFDLKQLLWFLTVSEDGAVPVHFKVADGNTSESRTHIDNWRTLRQLVGSADFLYIADCKLCSRRSLSYIRAQGGRFITVLPRSRKEDAYFRHWLAGHPPAWQPVVSYTNPVTGAVTDVVQAMDSPLPDPEGYRLIWYHSSAKQDQDAAWRQQQLERAVTELQQLKLKVERSRSRYTTRAGVAEKVEQILAHRGAQRWLRYRIEERQERRFRQEHRGRPGKQTRWRSSVKVRFALSWEPSVKGIEEDALQDGVFPLLTNCRELSMQEVLEAYRCKQPTIEKRHELLKTVLEVRPLFLKNISRIEAFLFLEFVALVVHALIEREIRRAMKRARITMLPLYPEERNCAAPTADRIFELFSHLQLHQLRDGSQIVKTFQPELLPVHEKILELLRIPAAAFRRERA